MAYSPVVRQKAVQMRLQQRSSIEEIHRTLGVSQGALSLWLREHPLTEEEQKSRQRTKNSLRRKPRVSVPSKLHEMASDRELSRAEKGRIAEAAVLLRLLLAGFLVYRPALDGGTVDWLAEDTTTRRILRIQVRWAPISMETGQPLISLVKMNGRRTYRRYLPGEFDFMIGYCLISDTAYVFSEEELSRIKKVVTAQPSAAERWDKLRA